MNKHAIIIFSLILAAAFLFTGCGPRYNFDFPPPYGSARLNEVFPASIKNSNRVETRLKMPEGYFGYEMSYVEGKVTMRVIECPTKEDAAAYFSTTVIDEFKQKEKNSYDNKNKRWKAEATDSDGRLWLAWVNENWVFVYSGADKYYFDLVIRASRFISKKK